MPLKITAKRFILILLTLYAAIEFGGSLLGSFNQPQVQGRLELYQTDLLLQASELEVDRDNPGFQVTQQQLLGEEPLEIALEQYDEARKSALKFVNNPAAERSQRSISEPDPADWLAELTLKQGILEASQGKVADALQRWQSLAESPPDRLFQEDEYSIVNPEFQDLAITLSNLWKEQPRLLPDTEAQLHNQLQGWFRGQTLERLYQLQQRSDALATLQSENQAIAQQALVKLFILSGLPIIGCVIGVGILIIWSFQTLRDRQSLTEISSVAGTLKQPAARGLSQPEFQTYALESPLKLARWEVPWDGEIVWQVLVAGFFFIGQIVSQFAGLFVILLLIPLLRFAGLPSDIQNVQVQAISVVLTYGVMALSVGGFLYWSIQAYLPLPAGWFRFRFWENWLGWGIAGYLVALPLVVLISLVNQQIWQGQGGSNPILSLALESQNILALACFFFTAAIAAPVFEELLFRGFLMASLTRYLPPWGAIALSALIFASAHLNLSEVLPLFMLGTVLGYVYSRSRNLLASILMHGLWNSATLLGLFVLGSSAA